MIWTKLKNNWPLLILLILHGALLFYDYNSIPFSHDELSAIDRCRFISFSELINLGVMPDGHPAGIQILLYLLIKNFGVHEWILKLPFVLAGIGSLYFIYKISASLFNRYAAITASIFFIFQSYYLSQIVVARPYSIGLLLSLGVVFIGLKIKTNPSDRTNYLILFLFAIGSFYSHYFSFLQTIISIGIFYAFYNERLNNRYFYLAVSAAIIGFLPHGLITLQQLGMGGLEWLGKPSPDFFASFLYNFYNSSYILLMTGIGLFLFSFFVKSRSKKTKPILLILFLLPVIILYAYSSVRAPVLQGPALFFCTPYLLIFSGNGINYFNKYFKLTGIIALALFQGYTLIISNQFYSLRNYQPIEKFVIQSEENLKNNGTNKSLVLWSGNSHYIAYYLQKYNLKNRIITTDTLKDIKQIDWRRYDAIICNQLPPNIFYALKDSFPFVQSCENNLLYTCMVLTRKSGNRALYKVPPVKLKFTIDSAKEWSKVSYLYKLDSIIDNANYFIEFKPLLDSSIRGAELVLETYRGEEIIDWRSVYLEPENLLSLKVKDVIKDFNNNIKIKLYIWNSTKISTKPIEVMMLIREDNPSEYIFKP